MADAQAFLVEIGTEELPPKSLGKLARAFLDQFGALTITQALQDEPSASKNEVFFSPRRLAIHAPALRMRQPDRKEERLGPAVAAAFAQDGKPTKAAEGFAKSCGVTVSQLERRQTEKGERLACALKLKGKTAAELLPQIVAEALAKLPIPKRMRWSAGEAEFVRPVHWIVLLLGTRALKAEILGVTTGNRTYGHRYHHPGAITLKRPGEYRSALAKTGKVLVEDRAGTLTRKIRALVTQAAKRAHGRAQLDEALLEEVAALVEWPVPVTGSFEGKFLTLPDEVIVAVLETQQRYFPLRDAKGKLLPRFIAISNIRSKQPAEVRRGNERVIVPRLTDAMFFWNTDRARRLDSHVDELDRITFQKELGSVGGKSRRVAALAANISRYINGDSEPAERAAKLAKCDLLTGMVGEFPELQGIMGGYYACHDGEPEEVARAIAEHYRPRFAGDMLPATKTGQALAIADKLDTIAGIFAIGQKPTGDKDPFGLRREALGLLRILIECNLSLNLRQLLFEAINRQPPRGKNADLDQQFAGDIFEFILERLRSYLLEQNVRSELFEAIKAVRRPDNRTIDAPLDFVTRIHALQNFQRLPQAKSLATLHKRIRNILRQATEQISDGFSPQDFDSDAERELGQIVLVLQNEQQNYLEKNKYDEALANLAKLQTPLERFFTDVMVMTDDPKVRRNRLGLLKRLDFLCRQVADVSYLPG